MVNGSACIILLVTLPWWWRPVALADALVLLAMGPVAILGQYCNIKGFRLAATAQLVPISYSGLVFAALLGLVFFDEWPRPAAIAGAAMICAGAIYLSRRKPLAPPVAIRRAPCRDRVGHAV